MSVYNDRDKLSAALLFVRKRPVCMDNQGFTLIELLIVLAIVAVLLVVASPNYDSIISGSKVDETRLGLATSLALARTEAIKRGETIRVCAGSSGNCASTDWNAGWKILRPDGEVLQVVQHGGGDASVSYDCGAFISFSNSGARDSSTGTCIFTVSKSGISKPLTINATGRVRMN
jgi:type IV fimbrial biogenesis protein FimT